MALSSPCGSRRDWFNVAPVFTTAPGQFGCGKPQFLKFALPCADVALRMEVFCFITQTHS
jgi:hypothetical protein